MSEIQEKVWVVIRYYMDGVGMDKPAKVFDDRKDAREYAKRMNKSRKFGYIVHGVKKG